MESRNTNLKTWSTMELLQMTFIYWQEDNTHAIWQDISGKSEY